MMAGTFDSAEKQETGTEGPEGSEPSGSTPPEGGATAVESPGPERPRKIVLVKRAPMAPTPTESVVAAEKAKGSEDTLLQVEPPAPSLAARAVVPPATFDDSVEDERGGGAEGDVPEDEGEDDEDESDEDEGEDDEEDGTAQDPRRRLDAAEARVVAARHDIQEERRARSAARHAKKAQAEQEAREEAERQRYLAGARQPAAPSKPPPAVDFGPSRTSETAEGMRLYQERQARLDAERAAKGDEKQAAPTKPRPKMPSAAPSEPPPVPKTSSPFLWGGFAGVLLGLLIGFVIGRSMISTSTETESAPAASASARSAASATVNASTASAASTTGASASSVPAPKNPSTPQIAADGSPATEELVSYVIAQSGGKWGGSMTCFTVPRETEGERKGKYKKDAWDPIPGKPFMDCTGPALPRGTAADGTRCDDVSSCRVMRSK